MTDFKEILFRIGDALMEAVFPTTCLVCEKLFPPPQKDYSGEDLREIAYQKVMAPFLCPTCLPGFSPAVSPICSKCGIMFKNRYGEDRVCNDCLMTPKRFRMARSFGVYETEGTFGTAIRRLKYNEETQLARPFQKLLLSAFLRHWDKGDIDLLIPVPLHIKRFRERGFNQAYLLFRHWHRIAEASGIDLSDIRIERGAIFKIKATLPQASLKGRERRENVKGAFKVRKPDKIKGKRILLVDDIYTTGGTVNECTKELLKNGAEYVDILTLGRRML